MAKPKHYPTPEQFDEAVDAYIHHCASSGDPVTWTGLALHMGFASRKEINAYREYEGYERSAQRAHLLVQNAYEKRLHGNAPTGAIFGLKNMGWSDKQALEHSGPGGGPMRVSTIQIVAGGDEGED